MPDAAREWMQVLLRVLLKYRVARAARASWRRSSSRSRSRSAGCTRCCATRADDAVHRRDTRRRAAAPRNRAAAAAAAPAASGRAGGRRQRADAGAGHVVARCRAVGGGRAAASWRALRRVCGRGALSSRRRWRRRRRAASRRSSSWSTRTWTVELTSAVIKAPTSTASSPRDRAAAAARVPAGPARRGPVRLLDVDTGCSSPSPTRRSIVRRGGDQRRPGDLDWVSRAAVAHEAVVESFIALDGRAADEAVHDLHERRARARARRGAARASTRVVKRVAISRSGASASCSTARWPRPARPKKKAARNAAHRRVVPGAEEGAARRVERSSRPGPATRSPICSIGWRQCIGDAKRRARERAAGAGRTAAARRGVSRAARAREACSSAGGPARRSALARRATASTVSGPWPPYTFVQD